MTHTKHVSRELREGNGPLDLRATRTMKIDRNKRAMALQTCELLKVKSDLRLEISDLHYMHIHVHITCKTLLVASEVTTASKVPWKSNLTSYLESVTLISYFGMSFCLLSATIKQRRR